MPYIRCVFSGNAAVREALASRLSSAAATALGKPEAYVCVEVAHSETLLFGGSNAPCAMVQVQSIGGQCSKVAEPLTSVISEVAGIEGDRVFVNFTAFAGNAWAMGGATFG